MNCQEFERIIIELARDEMLEATQRASTLAHAETCARCAHRLGDERALTLGLRSLATSVHEEQAPERVETALLATFRDRDSRVGPLRPRAPQLPARAARSHWRWTAAASLAAGLTLLFVALAATRLRQQPTQQHLVATARESKPLKLASWPALKDDDATVPEPAGFMTARRGPQPQLSFQRASNRTHNSLNVINRGVDPTESTPPVNVAANSSAVDIATDFIPLTYGTDLSNLDGGRVVRVELPRTALARFGLPVNAERAAEPVKADVLLGDDGLAQAIRFVR
jgi:hypothetical protein